MDSSTTSTEKIQTTKMTDNQENRAAVNFNLNLAERGTTYSEIGASAPALESSRSEALSAFDLIYRTLCAVMFNHSSSGHPGGSVSSGRIVQSLIFSNMRYDFSNPNDRTADLLNYTAGHKALGMYAMYSLRNELMRINHPDLLPELLQQMRLEDLLGFRKNPITKTPLFLKHNSKPLDGHPTPQTPFVWLSTGPSGVGVTAATGMALALKDLHGDNAPFVHMIEGEGGMTPGRVSEAMAAAASSGLDNLVMHVDWNQASIDSNTVTRSGSTPGDYTMWDPRELLLTHGFNVTNVADGFDFSQVDAAQKLALSQVTNAPRAIVYRTTKGWRYGIEGKNSHGGGHKFNSAEYRKALAPFEEEFGMSFPDFTAEKNTETVEQAYYDSLMVIRQALESRKDQLQTLADSVAESRKSHLSAPRSYTDRHPKLAALYQGSAISATVRPDSCKYETGSQQTLRGALADALNHINRQTDGAILAAAADVYGSTNTLNIGKGFGEGNWHSKRNPQARIFSGGGITEDAIGGMCSGIATIGEHIGVGASYGAFIAPLNVICARTHSIAQQTKQERNPAEPFYTFITVCGHAGVKTGEDGPTHAEPNTLAFFQDNCPRGTMITLTPWEAHELWPLMVTALKQRPAVIAPYVTRPNETTFDRPALGLAPSEASINGVYKLLAANGKPDGTIVYQGSDVTNIFAGELLPRLKEKGLNLDVYYVASCELFDALSAEERESIYPAGLSDETLMISGFSAPTMYRWLTSVKGRELSLYPHKKGKFLGSGSGEACLEEAGLHAEAQLETILKFIE
jgi:transketolase